MRFLLVTFCSLLFSCNNGEILEKERNTIRQNLETKKWAYAEDDGVFYVRHKNVLSENPVLLNNGDQICIPFYLMATYSGTIFYTNSKAQAEASNLGKDVATDEPLCVRVGGGQLMEGFDRALQFAAIGDSAEIFITSDRAYGQKNFGNIPGNTTIRIIMLLYDPNTSQD